jgi:predicted RecB family endonuclease
VRAGGHHPLSIMHYVTKSSFIVAVIAIYCVSKKTTTAVEVWAGKVGVLGVRKKVETLFCSILSHYQRV